MIKVLILGSEGFIGRHLAGLLSDDPELIVTGFGRAVHQKSNGNLTFVRGDFNDRDAVSKALYGQDIVYHLVSQTIPSTSWDEPKFDVERNLLPSLDLIELAAAAGVNKICFASSGGTVYGTNDNVIDETCLTEPFSPYGIVKRAIESFLKYAECRYGVCSDIYRISNAYGPGQNVAGGLGFINTALENIVAGRPVVIYGDGEIIRDFIYVKDAARILATSVLRNVKESSVFNVSANNPISLNDLLTMLRQETGIDFEVRRLPGRLNDNKKVMLDNSKIVSLSGISRLIPLEQGIRETYEFLKDAANDK